MEQILYSRQQYDATITRLDKINSKQDEILSILKVLKLNTALPPEYMEGSDITRQFHISKRTLARWRKEGRVRCHAVGNFFYFRMEDIIGKMGDKNYPQKNEGTE